MADFQSTDSESLEIQTEPLTEKLGAVIEKLPPTGVTLRDLMHLVGQDGLMILTALLSLVFIIPVSIPGVSTVFGAAILLITTSRLFGRDPWLPKSLQSRVISTEKLLPVFQKSLTWLHRLERVVRPRRLGWLTSGGLIGTFNNCSLILGAALLMAPFGLIPFSNTLPAVAVLCLSVGILQRDGACILLGYLGNLSSIIYFGVLIGGGGLAIHEALQRFSS